MSFVQAATPQTLVSQESTESTMDVFDEEVRMGINEDGLKQAEEELRAICANAEVHSDDRPLQKLS